MPTNSETVASITAELTSKKTDLQRNFNGLSLAKLAYLFFEIRYLEKSRASAQAAEDLKAANDRMARLGILYRHLVALDSKIADDAPAGAVTAHFRGFTPNLIPDEHLSDLPASVFSDRFNQLLDDREADLREKLFPTTNVHYVKLDEDTITQMGWRENTRIFSGGIKLGETTGADIHNAVVKLESLMQQVSTDNQYQSTQASTAVQATAGAMEALKSLADKFRDSLLRIVGA